MGSTPRNGYAIIGLITTSLFITASSRTGRAVDFIWSTGDFTTGTTAPEPLVAADTLFIQSGGVKRFVGANFTNQGLVRWQADALSLGNSASIQNSGIWQLESDANSLVWAFGGLPTFTNSGTFRKTNGITNNVGGARFVNNGGIINAQIGEIVFNGDQNIFENNSRFTGAGNVSITGSSTFNGNFQADSLVFAGGSHLGNAAAMTGGAGLTNGRARWTGGDLRGSWSIGNGTTFVAEGGGSKRQLGSNITNNGTFRWQPTNSLGSGNSSVLTNNSLIQATNSTALTWDFGGQPSLVNSSTGTVQATNNATLTLGNLIVTSNAGKFQADAGSTIVYSGTSNQFNDGTRFVGDNRMQGTSRFAGQIHSDGLRFDSGTQIGGDGTVPGERARLNGATNWQQGDLTGAWEIRDGSTFSGTGAGAKRQVGSDIVNNGTFLWSTGEQLQSGNNSVFTNNGLAQATSSATFSWIYGGQGAFVNNATGTVLAGNNSVLTFGNMAVTSNGGLFGADAGSAIAFAGTTNRFNSGTNFIGDVRMQGTSRFVGQINAEDMKFASGTQIGGDGSEGSRGQINGATNWQQGDLTGAWEIRDGSTFSGTGAGTKRQVGSDIVNNGKFLWTTEEQLQSGNSSVFINNGLTQATSSASFNWIYGGQGAFVNNAGGTVLAGNNSVLTFGNMAVTSNGGLFGADSGSAISFAGTTNRFNSGTNFLGDIRMQGTSRFVGEIQASNLRLVSGSHVGGDGSEDSSGAIAGTVSYEGGDISGSWHVLPDSTVNSVGGSAKRQLGGTIINDGVFNWGADSVFAIGNSAKITNNQQIDIKTDTGIIWAFGGQPTLENNSVIVKSAGSGDASLAGLNLDNQGTINALSGRLILPDNYTNPGTLTGTAAFHANGTLQNAGLIEPGVTLGTLGISGNFRQDSSGRLAIDIAGTSVGDGLANSYDQLNVGGTANLNGLLEIDLAPGYLPSASDVFTVLTAGNVVGKFSNASFGVVTLPQQFKFDVTYTPTSVLLSNFGPSNFSCDLNGDNSTDAGDAGIMFSNWGTSRGFSAGNCFPDNIIDAADAGVLFSEWTGDAVPLTVPEPIGFPLVGILLGLGMSRRPCRTAKR